MPRIPAKAATLVNAYSIVLLGLFLLQALHLACDPSPLKATVDFNDEGYWNHSARSKVLFGTFLPDDFNQGVAAAPLFTLVQWAVFSLCGVSIAAARVWSLVSLWLILLMSFDLLRRTFGVHKAMLGVLILGLMHEMLLYAKWATPIMPEACLLLGTFYFWELGVAGHPAWMAASAVTYVAAILTKLTAIYCLPTLALFLAVSYWVRGDVDRRRVLCFLVSGTVAGALLVVCFFLPNYRAMCACVGAIGGPYLSGDSRAWWQIPKLILHFFYVIPLASPGAVFMMMLASLWLLAFTLQSFKAGFRTALQEISRFEAYAVCWYLGCLPSLVIVPYRPNRRFAMFLVPFTLLAAAFVARTLGTRPRERSDPGLTRLPFWARAGVGLLLAGAWSRYALKAVEEANLCWLSPVSLRIPRSASWVLAGICAAAAAWYCCSPRPRRAVVAVLCALFAVNLSLDAVWYGSATYTIRDTSRVLAEEAPSGRYYIGWWCFELAMENQALPIYHPWNEAYHMNAWFADESQTQPFLFNIIEQLDVIGDPLKSQDFPARFSPQRVRFVQRLELCPLALGESVYRLQGRVYAVAASSPGRGKGVSH
jgi:hypothetical protein